MNPIVESLLLRSAVLFLMLGSLAGLVVGGLLIQSPHRLRKIGDILNRWVTTRHLDQTLDRSIDIDPWFYRHHRVSAGLILLASVYILYAFTLGLNRASAVIGLSRHFALPPILIGGLLDGTGVERLAGCVVCSVCQSVFVTASQHAEKLRAGRKPLGFDEAGTETVGNSARWIG